MFCCGRFYSVLVFFFFFRYLELWHHANSKHVRNNKKTNGRAHTYARTCVTYRPEVDVDLRTFTWGQCKLLIILRGNCTESRACFMNSRDS